MKTVQSWSCLVRDWVLEVVPLSIWVLGYGNVMKPDTGQNGSGNPEPEESVLLLNTSNPFRIDGALLRFGGKQESYKAARRARRGFYWTRQGNDK